MNRTELLQQLAPLSFENLNEEVQGKIPVHPKQLSEALNGGIRKGQTILIFARPGAGKTLLAVNICAGMLQKGMKVAYIANEEAKRVVALRFLSLLGRERLDQLDNELPEVASASLRRAVDKAKSLTNLRIIYGAEEMCDVETIIDSYAPEVVVLDQLRHMSNDEADSTQSGNTGNMESVQRDFRHLANVHKFIGITISQAGASAEGKAVLGMNDLDGSKTGTQGAVDLIIGMGVNDEMRAGNRRMLSICRNKISGKQLFFSIAIDEQHTLVCRPQA